MGATQTIWRDFEEYQLSINTPDYVTTKGTRCNYFEKIYFLRFRELIRPFL